LIWRCDDQEFDMHCVSVEGLEYLPETTSTQGVLVLTPALGNREFLMRYLDVTTNARITISLIIEKRSTCL